MNFSKAIDKVLSRKISSNNQIMARKNTPKILIDYGIEDLPMLITQKHIRQIIYTKQEAKERGYKIKSKDHYHGLGKELLIKTINSLDNPYEIYKQSSNNYLVITKIRDNFNNPIIVPIEINARGSYNNIYIRENQILTVYGHEYLKEYLNTNKYKVIYRKREITLNEGVKSHDIGNFSI